MHQQRRHSNGYDLQIRHERKRKGRLIRVGACNKARKCPLRPKAHGLAVRRWQSAEANVDRHADADAHASGQHRHDEAKVGAMIAPADTGSDPCAIVVVARHHRTSHCTTVRPRFGECARIGTRTYRHWARHCAGKAHQSCSCQRDFEDVGLWWNSVQEANHVSARAQAKTVQSPRQEEGVPAAEPHQALVRGISEQRHPHNCDNQAGETPRGEDCSRAQNQRRQQTRKAQVQRATVAEWPRYAHAVVDVPDGAVEPIKIGALATEDLIEKNVGLVAFAEKLQNASYLAARTHVVAAGQLHLCRRLCTGALRDPSASNNGGPIDRCGCLAHGVARTGERRRSGCAAGVGRRAKHPTGRSVEGHRPLQTCGDTLKRTLEASS
mmetsp:Transcript_106688/g.299769  ORF Transcript_106688/g.299769 Transcript_106688/m.299769 type:complete len:381 (+) Transcript_106688:331-1473(+)